MMGGIAQDAESTLAYMHSSGEVYRAQDIEAARGLCPVLGKLSLEEADLLLELEAIGAERLDRAATELQVDHNLSRKNSKRRTEEPSHEAVLEKRHDDQSQDPRSEQATIMQPMQSVHEYESITNSWPLIERIYEKIPDIEDIGIALPPPDDTAVVIAAVPNIQVIVAADATVTEQSYTPARQDKEPRLELADTLYMKSNVLKPPQDISSNVRELRAINPGEPKERLQAIFSTTSEIGKEDAGPAVAEPDELPDQPHSVQAAEEKATDAVPPIEKEQDIVDEGRFQEQVLEKLVHATSNLKPEVLTLAYELLHDVIDQAKETLRSGQDHDQAKDIMLEKFVEIFDLLELDCSLEEITEVVRGLLPDAINEADSNSTRDESRNPAPGEYDIYEKLLPGALLARQTNTLSDLLHVALGRMILRSTMTYLVAF